MLFLEGRWLGVVSRKKQQLWNTAGLLPHSTIFHFAVPSEGWDKEGFQVVTLLKSTLPVSEKTTR